MPRPGSSRDRSRSPVATPWSVWSKLRSVIETLERMRDVAAAWMADPRMQHSVDTFVLEATTSISKYEKWQRQLPRELMEAGVVAQDFVDLAELQQEKYSERWNDLKRNHNILFPPVTHVLAPAHVPDTQETHVPDGGDHVDEAIL